MVRLNACPKACFNTGTEEVSVARMVSPPGWSEPGQTPDFNEYTVVLKKGAGGADEGRGRSASKRAKQ